MSERIDVLNKIVELWGEQSNGRYSVVRGINNLAVFPFESYSNVAAISLDSERLCRNVKGMYEAFVSIVIAERVKEDREDKVEGINDTISDALIEDAREFTRNLGAAKNKKGDPIVFRIFSDESTEFTNSDYTVQGLIISFQIEY